MSEDETVSDESLQEAVSILRAGGVVVHPTSTVYGFGSLLSGPGLEALREGKARGQKGFVVLIPKALATPAVLGDVGARMAREYWPGPLTLVVSNGDGRWPANVAHADGSVAIRVADHPTTGRLIETLGEPMTSTSANPPGAPPAGTAEEAREAAEGLGVPLAVLRAGPLPGGLPSTLVDVRGERPRVLRQGALSLDPSLAESSGNPAMSKPFEVAFVCTGNTCRSPMAEAVARDLLAKKGIRGIRVRSAGVMAGNGQPASSGAVWAAAEAGLDLSAHESTYLGPDLLSGLDLVLTMSRSHLRAAEAMGAENASLLSEWVGSGGDVSDPFGAPSSVYAATFNEIRALVERAIDRIVQEGYGDSESPPSPSSPSGDG